MKKRSRVKAVLISIAIFSFVIIIAAAVLLRISNRIIKNTLEARFGHLVSVERIDIHWCQIDAFNIFLKNQKNKDAVKIASLSIKADYTSLFKKNNIISQLIIKNPYVMIERDKNGRIVSPVLPEAPEAGKKEKPINAEKPFPPLIFKKIEITGGSIDFIDGKTVGPPASVKLRDVALEVNDIALPLVDTFSTYMLKASIPGNEGKGNIKSSGKINLKTTDLECKIDAQKVNIVQFKPYFQKKSEVDVTKGYLDLDMNVKIMSRKVGAPGTAVLRNLEFKEEPRTGKTAFGVPVPGMVSFLKNNNNEISVGFIINGDLDDPKFSLSQDFVNKIVASIGEKIGVPSKGAATSMVENIMRIGKGIKKRFSK